MCSGLHVHLIFGRLGFVLWMPCWFGCEVSFSSGANSTLWCPNSSPFPFAAISARRLIRPPAHSLWEDAVHGGKQEFSHVQPVYPARWGYHCGSWHGYDHLEARAIIIAAQQSWGEYCIIIYLQVFIKSFFYFYIINYNIMIILQSKIILYYPYSIVARANCVYVLLLY